MRHSVIFAAAVLCAHPAYCTGAWFWRADLFMSGRYEIPADRICSETKKNTQGGGAPAFCTASGQAGLRLVFPDSDFRISGKLPDTAVSGYGALVSLERLVRFPFSVKAGTLSPRGSFSHLASPELSAALPAVSGGSGHIAFSPAPGLAVSLPGSSPAEKLFAVSLETPAVSAFVRSDGCFAVSAGYTFRFPRMMKAGIFLTGGRWKLGHTASSWFSGSMLFPSAWYGAGELETFFASPVFTSLLTVNAYGQPDGRIRTTYRSENAFTFGHFCVKAAGFLADGPGIRTTDNSVLSAAAQARLAPQYTWRFPSERLPALSAGCSALVQAEQDGTDGASDADVKYGTSLRFSDRYISSAFSATFAPQEAEYSVLSRLSFTAGSLRPSLSSSFSSDRKTTAESVRLSLSCRGILSMTFSASASFTQKNGGFDSGTASLGVNAVYSGKYIRYTLKTGAESSF
jgi:hypothetical protein